LISIEATAADRGCRSGGSSAPRRSGDPSQAFQTFKLKKSPLTWLNDPTGYDGRRSTLSVRVNGILWAEVPGFYGRGPQDEVYIIHTNESNASLITFGDGVTRGGWYDQNFRPSARSIVLAVGAAPSRTFATESGDSYSGIVHGQIAQLLDIPPLTFAREITVDGGNITIKRQSESGFDIVESTLPALVACSSGINEPRYPQLKGIMAAKKKEIRVYTAADLGLSPDQVGEKGAREKVLTIGRPPMRQAGKAVTDEGEGGKQIADFLAEIKVI
jgi:hypothetical protein